MKFKLNIIGNRKYGEIYKGMIDGENLEKVNNIKYL